MPTPPFITELRALVGQRELWLSSAVAVVMDNGRVLLGRRADTGRWALPGGIIEPGEQPADAAVRECFEETGVVCVPEVLTLVDVSGDIVHANGDRTQHLELTFLCRALGGEARVNDSESLEVAWFALNDLPELDETNLRRLAHAVDGDGRAAFKSSS